MWRVANKYLNNKTLAQVEAKPMDFPFWKGFMYVKDDFFSRGFFKFGVQKVLDSRNTLGWAVRGDALSATISITIL
jgi:hypothetical protein